MSTWFPAPSESTCCQEEAFVHESAYVDEPCQVGHATQIMHFSHVMANSVIGSHCYIGHHVTIASGILMGDYVRVLNNATLNSGVILEDKVYCGPSTVFIPLKAIRSDAGNVSTIQPTLVKRGAHLSANTTVAAGFTVGQYAFVESSTVVDSHVPDFAVIYGSPFVIAGWRCECGQTLTFLLGERTSCSRCGKKYLQRSETDIVQLAAPTASTRVTVHDPHLQSRSAIRPFKNFD